MTENMYRRPRRTADEVDAFSALHRAHGFRPGQRARQGVSMALRAGLEVS